MTLKTDDLRNLTRDELDLKLSGLKADLYNLRYQAASGRIEKPHKVKQIRRDIARIQTIFREGELKNAGSPKKQS
ncbi:MAG: 50S ribosomal protein L29 [Candidatus Omnitrophica bacterium]|nr:50S ribosomal protein L29 [Candidatus Omnitrophota bacterium]